MEIYLECIQDIYNSHCYRLYRIQDIFTSHFLRLWVIELKSCGPVSDRSLVYVTFVLMTLLATGSSVTLFVATNLFDCTTKKTADIQLFLYRKQSDISHIILS